MEGARSLTDALWEALPHRQCKQAGFEVYVPYIPSGDGLTPSICSRAFIAQQRRLLKLVPIAPLPWFLLRWLIALRSLEKPGLLRLTPLRLKRFTKLWLSFGGS